MNNESGIAPPMDHVFVGGIPDAVQVSAYDAMLLKAAAHPYSQLIYANDSRVADGGALCGSYGGAIAGTTHTMAMGPLLQSVFRNRMFKLTDVPFTRNRPWPFVVTVVDRVGLSRAFTDPVRVFRRRTV